MPGPTPSGGGYPTGPQQHTMPAEGTFAKSGSNDPGKDGGERGEGSCLECSYNVRALDEDSEPPCMCNVYGSCIFFSTSMQDCTSVYGHH